MPIELTDYVDRFVADRFKNLDGVADVTSTASGAMPCASGSIRDRLAGYGLTVQDVEECHPQAECRNPGRPHREQRARIHRAVAHLAWTAEEFSRSHVQVGRRAAGQTRRRGAGRARHRRYPPRKPLQWRDRASRSASSSRRSPIRSMSPRPSRSLAARERRTAGRRVGRHRLRFDGLHRPLHLECVHDDLRGRRAWWCSSS